MNNKIKTRLRHNAQIIRNLYLKKPFPKANVSIIEVYLENGISFAIGATSRVKSPVSIPQPKSQGGQFEPIIDSFSQRIMDTITIINQLFPDNSEGCQAIDEALDVLKNLLRVLDFGQAKEALLNILDDCFEGYAIFPGSEGRRDLFNWWLLEVIPASWCLEFPNKLYNIKGIQQMKNIKMKLDDSESIQAYRNRVMIYANDLWQEKDTQKRVTISMYLADAATTLARLEAEEAKKNVKMSNIY
ncbi:hypothetical protein [Aphanothece sacrum]|uniref:Uncharacterized protein n=1 Tax=Aphanothece sacrum FPU1 TaxID=1920663 RepID=A0A401ICZ9_APHSA|nr:hypothetical protein [Aphanothece sacrum]GBF79059.1 hypothetical protein AsFPU1_0451 [Aphanothece sacrum FPU1]GBF86018.1 hypothetical protein AsFPU3_3088 [Aphanothece sacrum FPU3]